MCAAFAPARADDAPAGAGPDVKTRSEVVRVVEELRTEAAKIRRLAWKHDVPADLLTRDQLKKELEAMILEDFKPDEYARDKKILQRLGLITADEDPLEMTKRFLEQGIAGFYNPKTKRLYIIDGLSVEAQRPTMLHELIHALEDQYIDLETRQKAVEKDSDALFALKCTIEGSAERARKIYEKANPEIAKLSQREQARSPEHGGADQDAPGHARDPLRAVAAPLPDGARAGDALRRAPTIRAAWRGCTRATRPRRRSSASTPGAS